jgi:hypothetical protein
MTDIPQAAIEAAAKAWHENGPSPASWEAASDSWKHGGLLRMEKAIESAMPAIREAIAQEFQDIDDAGCVEWAGLASDHLRDVGA